jgi:membrane fusion protein (multidrug efflux system)
MKTFMKKYLNLRSRRREEAEQSLNFKIRLLTSAATALLFALTISGCKPAEKATAQKRSQPPVSVKLVEPKTGDILRNVSLPADVIANQQAMLYSKVGGYLKDIRGDRGDAVNAGELIAEIEVPELMADLARFKAEFDIAELDYKRAADAQKKAPDLIVAQSIDTAKAKQAMTKANLDRAETLLGFTKITAPFSGVITKRFVDKGAFVPAATSGSAAQNAALVTLADFKTVRVQIAVPEMEVPRIKNGLPVKVTIDELPGKVFEGTVTRFSHALDDATKTMLAEVDLKNENGELRPGMYATAKIGVEKHSNVLLLPVEAVLPEKAGSSVFTVADGKAKKVPVKTGFNDGAFVEILEGVSANVPVILVGKMTLANEQPVSVEAK